MVTQAMKDYVWDKLIVPQLGYGFNLAHGAGYSLIAFEEAQLATVYNPLYWDCACLCVNAGLSDVTYSDDMENSADDSDDDQLDNSVNEKSDNGNDLVDGSVNDVSAPEGKKTSKRIAPNYGKIAKAISDVQQRGVDVTLPDINESDVDFLPNTSKNAIEYSLGAISGVGAELVQAIIKSRPYASLNDFCAKVQATDGEMISLIKAGCFDALEKKDRREILRDYCRISAGRSCALPATLTMVHLRKAIGDLGMGESFAQYAQAIKIMNFCQYARDNFAKTEDKKKYVVPVGHCCDFFSSAIAPTLNAAKNDYENGPEGTLFVKMTALAKAQTQAIAPAIGWLNSEAGRKAYSDALVAKTADAMMDENAEGSLSDWEMETLVYYHSEHPLACVDRAQYDIRPFDMLPETPATHTETARDGHQYKANDSLCTIVGTVVNADSAKHIVSLLTPDGVVSVKLFKNNYVTYAKRISYNDPDHPGHKITIEDSWFRRGTKLLVNGYRQENMFFAKGAFDRTKPWRRSPIQIIEGVGVATGTLALRDYRKGKE